jgi:hypothetical protein
MELREKPHTDKYEEITNELYSQLYAYVISISPPQWDLQYFERLIFVAQGVQCYGGKARRKGTLGRPRRRWEDGIRMDLREIGLRGVDWIRLAQDRDRWRAVVSAVMNLRVLAPRS